MRTTVKMPKVSDSADEVAILELTVAVGNTVGVGDSLMEVETGKATVSLPSPVAGVVREILVAVDDEVQTGAALVVIDT